MPNASCRAGVVRLAGLCVVAQVSVLGLVSPAAAKPPTGQHVISIAEARDLPLGTRVVVDGSITTPSGAFASSFFDNGFGLQDRTGGIYVSLEEDVRVAPRRQARVAGTLEESFGLLLLVPTSSTDVKLHGAGPFVQPVLLKTGDVNETTEGLLVRAVGVVVRVEFDPPYGDKLYMDDGSGELVVFVNNETGIDVTQFGEGDRISVTGFSSQFDDHYEIDPRGREDIVTLS